MTYPQLRVKIRYVLWHVLPLVRHQHYISPNDSRISVFSHVFTQCFLSSLLFQKLQLQCAISTYNKFQNKDWASSDFPLISTAISAEVNKIRRTMATSLVNIDKCRT
jgi:hypothetical protein